MSSSRASALRGASWFSHSALSTYCEAEGDGERFANGAGGRHDTVKVEEGRGSQRATVVKYALRCSLCSSPSPFVDSASAVLGKRILCREQEQWRGARRPVKLDRQRRLHDR